MVDVEGKVEGREKKKRKKDPSRSFSFFFFFFFFFRKGRIFFFFTSSLFFYFFFNVKNEVTPLCVLLLKKEMNKIVQILLEKGEPNVDLADQVLLLIFFYFFFFFFHFFIFLFFFIHVVKDGKTPLFLAAQEGHEQIVGCNF